MYIRFCGVKYGIMQTQSSKYFSIAFPPELLAGIRKCALCKGVSVPFLVRKACIEYISQNGFDVSDIENPAGRGVRSDLRRHPVAQKKQSIKSTLANDTNTERAASE